MWGQLASLVAGKVLPKAAGWLGNKLGNKLGGGGGGGGGGAGGGGGPGFFGSPGQQQTTGTRLDPATRKKQDDLYNATQGYVATNPYSTTFSGPTSTMSNMSQTGQQFLTNRLMGPGAYQSQNLGFKPWQNTATANWSYPGPSAPSVQPPGQPPFAPPGQPPGVPAAARVEEQNQIQTASTTYDPNTAIGEAARVRADGQFRDGGGEGGSDLTPAGRAKLATQGFQPTPAEVKAGVGAGGFMEQYKRDNIAAEKARNAARQSGGSGGGGAASGGGVQATSVARFGTAGGMGKSYDPSKQSFNQLGGIPGGDGGDEFGDGGDEFGGGPALSAPSMGGPNFGGGLMPVNQPGMGGGPPPGFSDEFATVSPGGQPSPGPGGYQPPGFSDEFGGGTGAVGVPTGAPRPGSTQAAGVTGGTAQSMPSGYPTQPQMDFGPLIPQGMPSVEDYTPRPGDGRGMQQQPPGFSDEFGPGGRLGGGTDADFAPGGRYEGTGGPGLTRPTIQNPETEHEGPGKPRAIGMQQQPPPGFSDEFDGGPMAQQQQIQAQIGLDAYDPSPAPLRGPPAIGMQQPPPGFSDEFGGGPMGMTATTPEERARIEQMSMNMPMGDPRTPDELNTFSPMTEQQLREAHMGQQQIPGGQPQGPPADGEQFTPASLSAMDTASSAVGDILTADPTARTTVDGASVLNRPEGEGIEAYMNAGGVSSQVEAAQREADRITTARQGRQAQAGAFGSTSSRAALEDIEAGGDEARMIADIRRQGFDAAASRMDADVGRDQQARLAEAEIQSQETQAERDARLRAAQIGTNIGSTIGQEERAIGTSMMDMGKDQEAIANQQRAQEYEQWLRQQEGGGRELSLLNSMMPEGDTERTATGRSGFDKTLSTVGSVGSAALTLAELFGGGGGEPSGEPGLTPEEIENERLKKLLAGGTPRRRTGPRGGGRIVPDAVKLRNQPRFNPSGGGGDL